MVEDEAKRKLIRNIRDNLENEPSVKRENLPGFQSDNLQIKLQGNKAKIIKRGERSISVDIKMQEEE